MIDAPVPHQHFVSVVIPAMNEEDPIAEVVREVLATNIPREVIVVDNASKDRTAERAQAAGARVVSEPTPGYGRACATGVRSGLARMHRDPVPRRRRQRRGRADAAHRAADLR
jgi:glycosyltransferase involved in cell wall biosynthesis